MLSKLMQRESFRVYCLSGLFYMTSCMNLTLACKTIQYWMADLGWSKAFNAAITSFLHLPYSFRILFVPWLEYIKIPTIGRWGHRKSLIFYMNCLSALCIAAMSFIDVGNFKLFLPIALLCSIISTATESLSTVYFMHAYPSSVKVSWVQGGQMGYAISLYVGTTVYMYMSQFISWNNLYFISFILVIFNLIPVAMARNCTFERVEQPSLKKVYAQPIKSFYQKHKPYFGIMTIFSLFYRAPDKMLAPVFSLIIVDIFGKNGAFILKTLALGATFIGSMLLGYARRPNQIDTLMRVSIMHMTNILAVAVLVAAYLAAPTSMPLLLALGFMYLILRITRTVESSAVFAYQCSLFDKDQFSGQSGIGNLADKGFGDLLGSISGLLSSCIGASWFLASTVLFVLPAWIVSPKLKKSFKDYDSEKQDNQ